jgi:hypothetical protein
MGRPSIYSDGLAAEICERLASGESLNAICADPCMPTRQAVHEWVADNRAGFGDKYARARTAQADHYADEIIEIVDSEADPARARVRMDGRKWVASKLAPRKYGEKLETENHNTINVSDSLAALLERIEVSGRKIYDPRPE